MCRFAGWHILTFGILEAIKDIKTYKKLNQKPYKKLMCQYRNYRTELGTTSSVILLVYHSYSKLLEHPVFN